MHHYKVECRRKESHGNIALAKGWGMKTSESSSKLLVSPGRVYPSLSVHSVTRCQVMLLLCDRIQVQLEQEHMLDHLGKSATIGPLSKRNSNAKRQERTLSLTMPGLKRARLKRSSSFLRRLKHSSANLVSAAMIDTTHIRRQGSSYLQFHRPPLG